MYESQRDQLANQQFNVDQTSFAIETVKNTQVTVAAMKDASKTLKKEQKKISLAELEDMQDDMEGYWKLPMSFRCRLTFALPWQIYLKTLGRLERFSDDLTELRTE